MKRKKTIEIDRDYLRRCKESTPEQRIGWLQAAAELVEATQKARRPSR